MESLLSSYHRKPCGGLDGATGSTAETDYDLFKHCYDSFRANHEA